MTDLERVREYFKADKFAALVGIAILEASPDRVVCSMDLTEHHFNAGGVPQGGAVFTLADTAFGVHCNVERALGADVNITLGQSCAISYLKGSRGKTLTATSQRLSKGRSISVYRVRVTDDLGVAIAEMTGNAFTK
ncbi:phenylacetic acid degradation protein [Clostridia bacterium]|nr:phenylacetic acid degradation protein [Clostridia bacterium]